MRPVTAAILLLVFLVGPATTLEAATSRDVRKKMGSRFEITAVHAERSRAEAAIEAAYAEIDRLEGMISSWRDDSETGQINRNAGIRPTKVSPELLGLIERSLKVGELTGGAFDITFASAGHLWDFKAEDPKLPAPEQLAAALEHVDYRRVQLDKGAGTVLLEDQGSRIGFGGIGKGFAANRASRVMRDLGIEGGLVNAGGDLLAFGRQEDGKPWTVGIADPTRRDAVFAYLDVSNQAVVTSGDYESYVEIDGVRYAHILDPRTGYPVREIRSVTVLCPDAELADALATASFVLGREKGIQLIDRLKNIEAVMVTMDGEMIFSRGLETHFVQRTPNEDREARR